MVSKRISELPAAGDLDGSEQIPLTQSGETRRIPSDTYQNALDIVTPEDHGAVGDGTADDTTALADAIAAGPVQLREGKVYRFTSQLTVAARQELAGHGHTSSSAEADRAPAVLLKDGSFDGIVVGDDGVLRDVQVDGASGNGGDGVHQIGSRSVVANVSSTNHGGEGHRIGGKVTGVSTNLWRAYNLFPLGNGGHGFFVHDAGGPNVNAGLLDGLDARGNGGDGYAVDNCFYSHFYGVTAQSNGGYGGRFYGNARRNWLWGSYLENNTSGDGIIDSGAEQNVVIGSRNDTAQWTDNGTNSLILEFTGSFGNYRINRLHFALLGITDEAISGQWHATQDGSNRDLIFELANTGANAGVRFRSSGSGIITQHVDALIIGGGKTISRHLHRRSTVNPGTVAAQDTKEVTQTVTGAVSGDTCYTGPESAIEAGIMWSAWVSGADTVTIRVANVTASNIDVTAAAWNTRVVG